MIWLLILNLIINDNIQFENVQIPFERNFTDNRMTPENIKAYIEDSDIYFKDQVYNLIMLESGNLKSALAIKGSNILGMRLPRQRQTTAIGTIFGYARYGSWQDCVDDYILWQNHKPPKQGETFKCYLNRRHWNK